MVTLEDKGPRNTKKESVSLNDNRIVSFKESYLDNLVEAEALLEVVGKMVTHHDDIQINPKAFMGVSILVEKIAGLIDINENIIPNNATIPPELDS